MGREQKCKTNSIGIICAEVTDKPDFTVSL
jgi:hypothetical protein